MKQAFNDIPAPALAKGLWLLEQLAVDGQLSLERIATRNGWPKSSTLRYLLTLEGIGAVRQNPDTRHWQALKALRPLSLPGHALRFFREKLPELAERSGHCAELYQVHSQQVKLIDRADPENSEIVVSARIGFERGLTELDSTAALYYAFTPAPPPSQTVWMWQNGEQIPLTASQRNERISRARNRSFAEDADFNEHGIRRFAVPLLNENQLQGILAIAQRQTPLAEKQVEQIRDTLASAASTYKPDPLNSPRPEPTP